MQQIFTLNGTLRRDPAIDAWFKAHPEILRGIAREWFDIMRSCGPEVREIMHDGFPTACVGNAAFAHVATYSAHVNVAFFHGASLDDPQALLEGKGRYMRHVKIRPDSPVDQAALTDLIHDAYHEVRTRIC